MHPVQALFRRHAWATDRLLRFCEGRPEVAAPAAEDVYGGIEPLFNHIVIAETGYLRLVTGELPEDRVREGSHRPLEDLGAPARWLAERWAAALAAERDPEVVLPYQRGDDPELMPDWLPLIQCVHHGDDHRAQVATLLGRHGVEAPSLDGWDFGDEMAAGGDGGGPHWWGSLLRRGFAYHLWATERLLEHCRGFSPEQLALSAPGTYGSILETLDHLVSSDRSYLSRLRGGGRTPPLGAAGPEPLLEHLSRQREGWLGYLDSGPDFGVLLERTGGESPAWVFVLQAIHHGNDHRTHVGTVLLNHDLEAPEIDVWSYGFAERVLRPLA